MRATLCFLGPFIGRHPGYVTTQDLVLSDLFSATDASIICASSSRFRLIRLSEIIGTILARRSQIDLVVLSIYTGRSFVVEDIASALCHLFRLPLVMVLHGGNIPDFMATFPSWARRVLRRADALVAPSPYLIEAVAHYGFSARLIPNVIHLDNYVYRHRDRAQPRMFWMRSFHPIYNPEMAVRVLAAIRQRLPTAGLVMAGQDKGSLLPAKDLATELHLNDAIEFPGFVDMVQKAHYGAICDICINTSRIDNMPVALVEMCAMGLPVVSTDVGGIPQLLTHEQTGLLVPNEDVHAMADSVYRLVENPSLVSALSANGRRLAEASSWDNVRPQWERLFESLIRDRKI